MRALSFKVIIDSLLLDSLVDRGDNSLLDGSGRTEFGISAISSFLDRPFSRCRLTCLLDASLLVKSTGINSGTSGFKLSPIEDEILSDSLILPIVGGNW